MSATSRPQLRAQQRRAVLGGRLPRPRRTCPGCSARSSARRKASVARRCMRSVAGRSRSAIAAAAAVLGAASWPAAVGVASHGSDAAAAGPDPTVDVFPIPGARVASPQTQIAFRGKPVGELGRITVTGSRSGPHAGRVYADSDQEGGSFLPAKPFVPGEVVTVRTGLHIRGGEGGHVPLHGGHTRRGRSRRCRCNPAPRVPGDELIFQFAPGPDARRGRGTKQSSDAAPGDIFITPQQGPTQNGAMILGGNGQLVWFHPVPKGDMAADLRVQDTRPPGADLVAGLLGRRRGRRRGRRSTTPPTGRSPSVHAGNGLSADLHEFRLTPQGTALITAYYPVLLGRHGGRTVQPADRARLGRAGDRRQDRPGPLPVGQPRPRAAGRHLRGAAGLGGRAVRLLPHQLGAAAARTATC